MNFNFEILGVDFSAIIRDYHIMTWHFGYHPRDPIISPRALARGLIKEGDKQNAML